MADLFDDSSMGYLKPPTRVITGANATLYIAGNQVGTATRVTVRPDNNLVRYHPIGQRTTYVVPTSFTVSGSFEKALVSIGALRLLFGKTPEVLGEMNIGESYPNDIHPAGDPKPDWEELKGFSPLPYYFTLVLQADSGHVSAAGDQKYLQVIVEGCQLSSNDMSVARQDIVIESCNFLGEKAYYDYSAGDIASGGGAAGGA